MFFLKKKNYLKLNNVLIHKKFLLNKENLFLNNLINNQKIFTINYSSYQFNSFLNKSDKSFLLKTYSPRLKVNKRVLESKNFGKEAYDFLTSKNFKFNEKSLKYLIKNFSNTSFLIFSSNSL
jgi:hypothetical protein